MITTAELNKLKELAEFLTKLIPRIPCIPHSCQHCGNRDQYVCSVYGALPVEIISEDNECDKWDLEDLPF